MVNRIALDVIERQYSTPITLTTVLEDDYTVQEDGSFFLPPNSISISTGNDAVTFNFSVYGQDEDKFDENVRAQIEAAYTLANLFSAMAEHLEAFVG